jgi:outer membrane protein, heavy metal efflux system
MVQLLLIRPASMRLRSLVMLLSVASMCLVGAARADGVVPPASELPQTLTLDEALRIFHTRGLDLLIAQAAVKNAEGQVQIAGAIPNPIGSVGWGKTINYDPGTCDQCSTTYWALGLSDSAALEDSVSGKRGLRLRVARNSLAAAKMSRVDAERSLAFQVKAAYLQVAQAVLGYKFAREVADTNAKTLDVFQTRYRSGAINEGDVARIETQKLEADQALDQANQSLRQARVALAFLVGVRGLVTDFDVDVKVLDFAAPVMLADATETSLLRTAFDHRSDLIAAGYSRASAEAQIALTKRQRFPDVTLGVNYTQIGTGATQNGGAVSPPTLSLSVSAPLPVFYQLQGETRQAEAQYEQNSLQQAKTTAQVVNDVSTGYAGYATARQLVLRMEGGLLKSAKTARDITRLQYEKGAASLTDFLDAQRTYIATNVEYFQDLTNYWTAVFQLEQAIGTELH